MILDRCGGGNGAGTGTGLCGECGCGEQECCIDGDSWLNVEPVFSGENGGEVKMWVKMWVKIVG